MLFGASKPVGEKPKRECGKDDPKGGLDHNCPRNCARFGLSICHWETGKALKLVDHESGDLPDKHEKQ